MKRNLLKIPQGIIERINKFDVDDVVAACAKQLRPEDINNYSHLGMKLVDGNLSIPCHRGDIALNVEGFSDTDSLQRP